jgi:hypothetical protein
MIIHEIMSSYLYVWSPADDGQVDRENDNKDEYAGEQEQPVLTPELHTCKIQTYFKLS